MTKVSTEYMRYQASGVMKQLGLKAHGENYVGQTSSATYQEISDQIGKMGLFEGSRVLDAGSGNGAFSNALAQAFDFVVEGVDLAESLVQEARQSGKASFFVGDFTELSQEKEGFFDLVMCIGSLYWGQPLEKTLEEWHRITGEKGKLLIFLNLQYGSLQEEERKAIGVTQFISTSTMSQELSKANWVISEWIDGTETYRAWLEKFCFAMKENEEEITKEMGEVFALQLIHRFTTYYQLAERNAVRRIIIRAEKGEA